MKLTVKQSDLNRGLSIVSHAISSRSTLPILANILLTTGQDHLKLSATNLEIGINCLIDAEVSGEGTTTIPAKTFVALVSSLRDGDVVISADEGSFDIRVKSTGSNATIKGMDPAEFPQLPSAEGGKEPIILDASLLKEMISQVAFAAAQDDGRPVLTGVLVEVHEGTYDGKNTLTFSSADAFRLARRVASISEQGIKFAPASMIIPAKSLNELARVLPSEGSVQMVVDPNRSQVLFHTEQIDLVSRLIEGTFPNVMAAIPKEHETRVVVETKELVAAVKSVTPFARDSSNIVRVTIASDELNEDSMTLESTAEDIGSNVTTINANVEGVDQEIIFNVRYLSEVLAVIDTPEVALEVISASRPGVVKPVSSADYTYVIMPMSAAR